LIGNWLTLQVSTPYWSNSPVSVTIMRTSWIHTAIVLANHWKTWRGRGHSLNVGLVSSCTSNTHHVRICRGTISKNGVSCVAIIHCRHYCHCRRCPCHHRDYCVIVSSLLTFINIATIWCLLVFVELSDGITRRRSEKPNVNIQLMHSCILRVCGYKQLCVFFFNFPNEHNIIKNAILFLSKYSCKKGSFAKLHECFPGKHKDQRT